nr:hypothetical protein CFP56_71449 [Quercus suber]
MSLMQASAIEARSLSSLVSIASRPPLDPAGPIPPPALPLVLYIARVPGSRDVFLTPLKPREKIVTAEDVQSSLYYVHIHCEDDHAALETTEPPAVETNASDMFSTGHTDDHLTETPRPPLPARRSAPPLSPPYPIHDTMPGQDCRQGSPPKAHRIARKPVLGDITNRGNTPPSQSQWDRPSLPPRPLPALPEEHGGNNSLHVENMRPARHLEQTAEINPYLHAQKTSMDSPLPNAPDPEPGTLTVIRRDPASSEQWNVASIHDPPVHEISSTALLKTTAARRTKKGGAPLYLDLTNPGYAAFIDTDRSQSRTSTSSGTSSNDTAPEGVFRRRLYMPGSRYGEHNYARRKLGSEDSSLGTNKNNMPSSMRSINTNPEPTTVNNTPPSFDARTKGYTFTSPWNGHCEFHTGATGKSLKCVHSLGGLSTMEVSELRFNLPSKSKPTSSVDQKRSSYFSHQRHQSVVDWEGGVDAPTIVLGDDGRIDRSLGQEKAGGGFGGKQAKLGKLIIEPEGLKMLDLLVAANMGLWWRAYERS